MPNSESSRALRNAEARHRDIVNSARSFAIVVTDLKGSITDWNEGAHRILGWSEEEALGQTVHIFFTPEDVARRQPENEMETALEQGFSPDERWHRRRSGELFWASGELTPLKDEHGQAAGFVKILRDQTDQLQAGAELARLNASLEARVIESNRERDRLWRNSLDLLLVIGTDGILRNVNPAWTAILGYGAPELIGNHFSAFVHPDDVEPTRGALEKVVGEPVVHFEIRLRAKEGGYRWIDWTAASEDGLVYANGRDVTREKAQAQQLARTQAARLQLALAVGEMGVWEWDIRSDRVHWLEGAAALHGRSPDEAPSGFSMEEYARLLHPNDQRRLKASIQEALSSGKTQRIDYRVVWPDGSVHWLEARGEVFADASGQPERMMGVTVDMTRRKRTERDLEFLSQASAELARLVDPRSTLAKLAYLAVPSFADWCAVDLLEEDGRLKRVAVAHVDPEKVQMAREMSQRFPPDPEGPIGAWKILRSGQPELIPEATDRLLEHAVRNPEYRAVLRKLGLKSYIGVPILARGRAMGAVSFVTTESGRVYDASALALAEDFARRASVAIENARLYEALQESDKSKDVFIATLAHELRNPLAAIANAMQVLDLAATDRKRVEDATRIIARQVGQLSHLVDDLMDISRITTGKIELRPQETQLAGILSAAVETSRAQIEAGRHRLSVTLPGEATGLVADPTRLTQVFANLLHNAAKYTPPGGRIELALECTASEFLVRVRDSGVGIPPERLRDVFKMFTQLAHPLERSQGGLGIGLALVDGWVRLHGGRVEAHSAGPGQGSEFVVRLPRPPAPAEAAPAAAPAAAGASGMLRRILVVDDNLDAAHALAELLGLLGHEVVGLVHEGPAASGAVLELRPDIVLLDIGLPGMNGYEVARRIRAQEGGRALHLIALTGWGMDSDKERAFEAGFDHHWVKPVRMEQLLELARMD